MRRFEREVTDPVLINEMLKLMDTAYIGVNDADGIPYVVPLSFGYEMTDALLKVYIHTTKAGKKIDLFSRDPRVCVTFSEFNDFPDNKYKGHYHDYRSVIAKGTIKLLDYNDDPAEWEKGYNLLYTCNNREIKPLHERKAVPNMYIGVIACDMKDVTAKSEFPLRSAEDVPFMNVYDMPADETPFDISDIIRDRKARMAEQNDN